MRVSLLTSHRIIIDIAVPLTHNIQKTEREKIAKYENLSIELKRLWKLEKVETYALVISSEGVMTSRFAKNIAALGLSYNIIRNGQKAVVLQTCHISVLQFSSSLYECFTRHSTSIVDIL
ncbi:hypothetical protein NQ318_002738 [Aromia moschata]|uniref:Uncharacterized protein n=1 Tax=Aromia moschata TaxID=1265417 RepID=A0AAV8Y3E9_9CUCU|nr:hypothetical protein NQ318_002738 [Aromia moschata]